MTLTIGLTGGIGSGKSAASQYFAKLGVQVIDTDVISKNLTRRGQPALEKIKVTFPTSVFSHDGTLDRGKMRNIIFSDTRAKLQLETILHPLIRQEVALALGHPTKSYRLLVVPLLWETKEYKEMISRTLVVDCDEETQRQRAMTHHKISRAEVDAIMATQLPRAKRLEFADDVLDNDGDLASLYTAVTFFHHKYMQLSVAAHRPSTIIHE